MYSNMKRSFHHKKPFVCSVNKIDKVLFLHFLLFNNLSKEEKKAYNWVSMFLHRLPWDKDDYPYSYLNQICDSVCSRNPNSEVFVPNNQFFAKLYKNCILR